MHDQGRQIRVPEQRLWFRVEGPVTFDALRTRLQRELGNVGHIHDVTTTHAVLYNYALRPRAEATAVPKLNELIASITECDVTQVVVLPFPPPGEYRLRFGRFRIGQLDGNRLGYRCRKAGSDYWERYRPALEGNLSVERDLFQAKVVDWAAFAPEILEAAKSIAGLRIAELSIFDDYFQAYASELYTTFWNGIQDDEPPPLPVGNTFFLTPENSALLLV